MIPAKEAIDRLQAGNARYVAGSSTLPNMSPASRERLSEGQQPFAVIFGCSDSRVPVEHIFDQGFGQLFVIRVAGNVVAPSLIGSVEYAVEVLGTRLVVVLGHTGCGAVDATLDALQQSTAVDIASPNLGSIVRRIRPAVEELFETELVNDRAALAHHAVRANVRSSAGQLRTSSEYLESLIESGELLVVGAEYSLESGVVDFFEGVDRGD